jgi:hypothetical protein
MKKIKIDISKELWDYVKSNEGKVLCLWPKHLKDEFIQILRNSRYNTQWVVASGAELVHWCVPKYSVVHGWETYRFHPDVEPDKQKYEIKYVLNNTFYCPDKYFIKIDIGYTVYGTVDLKFFNTREEARKECKHIKSKYSRHFRVVKAKVNLWDNSVVEVIKENP